jgi:transcriptional regulator with XRE-family HTH domain
MIFSIFFKNFRNEYGYTQEQFAHMLLLDRITIANYESGKATPSMPVLKKMVELLGISLDYLILYENCQYPRNLKLLKLAKKLDVETYSEARSSIEAVINTFWSKKLIPEINYRLDNPVSGLTNSFNQNLKELRNQKKMTQAQLAQTITVSRTLLNQYETKTFPPIERLIELSKFFDLSMHAMITGENLTFVFDDKFFGKIILLADQHLTIEEKKTLINLLEATIENKK